MSGPKLFRQFLSPKIIKYFRNWRRMNLFKFLLKLSNSARILNKLQRASYEWKYFLIYSKMIKLPVVELNFSRSLLFYCRVSIANWSKLKSLSNILLIDFSCNLSVAVDERQRFKSSHLPQPASIKISQQSTWNMLEIELCHLIVTFSIISIVNST